MAFIATVIISMGVALLQQVLYENIDMIMKMPGVTPHIYGKKKSRLNRKMGHITIVNKNINDAIEMSKEIRKIIKVTSK